MATEEAEVVETNGADDATVERKAFITAYVKANPLMTSGAALYKELEERFPEVTGGGHRGMVGRMFDGARPWEQGKGCPNNKKGCKTVANDMGEAIALFGTRYKGMALQSYCKPCRNEHRKLMRAKKKAEEGATTAGADVPVAEAAPTADV
jgi:hypothetical protein